MSKIWQFYTSPSLILRIVVGLAIGAVAGAFLPNAEVFSVFGQLFVGALKAIAPLLVFVLVSSALMSQREKDAGKLFSTIIFLYLFSTLLSAFTAVIFSFCFPVTLHLTDAANDIVSAPKGIWEVLSNLLTNIVSNPVKSLAEANYLAILFWAVLFGIAMRVFASHSLASDFQSVADGLTKMVRWIIEFSPFGIMGLVYQSVSSNGLGVFTTYGKLLAVLVGCMMFVALVVAPILVAICTHANPYPLVLTCYKKSGITAFFTRSSAANIPINMRLCEDLGIDKNVYSVSLPLGATVNMNGAAVTITVMTLAAVHTLGITVDLPTALLLSVLAAAGACGASGVTGGSLLLIPMACSLFGISNDVAMQVVGVGFVIGVVQDSFETALNSSTDVIYAAAAEFREKRKNKWRISI